MFRARAPAQAKHLVAACVLAVWAAGCATIPKQRYAVTDLEVNGVEQLDPEALKACLATHERPWFQVSLGRAADPECGVPPFDADRVMLSFWRWPWTEWPLFDRSVFERDVERVERWYRARGYYDARVLSTSITPPAANESDRIEEGNSPCGEEDEGCEVSIGITVEEGEPVMVRRVDLDGIEGLPRSVRTEMVDTLRLAPGDRFDEEQYDRTKDGLQDVLANASYAKADVQGDVSIHAEEHYAVVRFDITPGPPCVFGDITVEGYEEENLPADTIAAAALIDSGDRFTKNAIGEAQRAIYALGAFSTVEIIPQIPDAPDDNVVPLVIRVVPGRLTRFGLGAGLQIGNFDFQNPIETLSVPQWDVHLLGIMEFRNLFGGLRRLRIEDRPRLIFTDPKGFPRTGKPRPGNDLRLQFAQPAFLEPRTTLAVGARWDLGPDPFKAFFRHDLTGYIGPERDFFDGRLFLALRLNENILVPRDQGESVPSAYDVMFLEQIARLDLRDNPRDPRYGAYFGVAVDEAGYGLPASWNYVRLTPEARGYVPLPLDMVFAGRFAVGTLFITNVNDPDLDQTSARLGPERYRLRGGGATSVRGYLPGRLGDSEEGGLRRWEASIELRVPITANFGTVAFADAGDVHAGQTFRFDYLHLSVGLGLRYRTIVGPVRFDVGYQVPQAQVLGAPDRVTGRPEGNPKSEVDFFFVKFPGAVHLTIGEAF